LLPGGLTSDVRAAWLRRAAGVDEDLSAFLAAVKSELQGCLLNLHVVALAAALAAAVVQCQGQPPHEGELQAQPEPASRWEVRAAAAGQQVDGAAEQGGQQQQQQQQQQDGGRRGRQRRRQAPVAAGAAAAQHEVAQQEQLQQVPWVLVGGAGAVALVLVGVAARAGGRLVRALLQRSRRRQG
jgi:hypothetical protein